MDGQRALSGGYVTKVVRVGDTVRRRATGLRPFVRDLLRFLERALR